VPPSFDVARFLLSIFKPPDKDETVAI